MPDFQNEAPGTLLRNLSRPGFVSVTDLVARDAIPSNQRRVGMWAYVISNSTHYSLGNDLVTWTVFGS